MLRLWAATNRKSKADKKKEEYRNNMKKTKGILPHIFFIFLALGCLQACQEDNFGEGTPDRETLIAQGRYVTARNVETAAAQADPDKSTWFPVGTLYRLVAFSKTYSSDDPHNAEVATFPRFNKVAWEGETGGLRFINLDTRPDKWFGFMALDGEKGDLKDGLVSLDFYSFTYGKKVDKTPKYIELDGLSEETTPTSLEDLKRTEEVKDGELNDLMRGYLLNQNIVTAGTTSSTATQSIMPFKHCFSRLHFIVVQQPKEDDENVGQFPGIYVTDVKVTNTYSKGEVYLQDGKVLLPNEEKYKEDRTLKLIYTDEVKAKQKELGEMIVFPSDGSALKNDNLPDGYKVGLKITVKGKDEKTINQFLTNTGSGGTAKKEADGYWYGTIIKEQITNSRTNDVLYFRQNTTYTLVISFQKDAVRIITVIPQVEEWLVGEGTDAEPWQEQAIGQPQMFDNVVWSDRNLGADHYDPLGDNFDKTVGYFYQSGRNIPYFPFEYHSDQNSNQIPKLENKNTQNFADQIMQWRNTDFRFFPIVDEEIRKMTGEENWTMKNDKKPQMVIPEEKPQEDFYFDFMAGRDAGTNSGLKENQDEHWEEGQSHQPVSGAWVLPSTKDFQKIFPSTPLAGNITMRSGNTNDDPMNWGPKYGWEIGTKTLRLTVPFYTIGSEKPVRDDYSTKYLDAWNILKNNKDEGTTHIEEYILDGAKAGPDIKNNLKFEPDGDPEDGYASVYVISREKDEILDNTVSLLDYVKDPNYFAIKQWGTIYAIKNIYTPKAYRMRWRALIAPQGEKTQNPCIYIEICRYRCTSENRLTEENYKEYDWEHPAATLYFPVCGLGDWTSEFINFGTECQYATSDEINKDGKTGTLQIKITGDNANNAYISVLREAANRNFGKQIRPVGGVKNK